MPSVSFASSLISDFSEENVTLKDEKRHKTRYTAILLSSIGADCTSFVACRCPVE